MFKRNRLIFAAVLVALLSVFALTRPDPAEACPMPPPNTLLELYLRSDLIVVADYSGENLISRENEDDVGFWANLEQDLAIVKTLKGPEGLKNVSYTDNEYRSVPNPVEEVEQEAAVEDGNLPIVRFRFFNRAGFERSEKVSVGKRYLFFLTKDEESGDHRLTDYVSGIRESAEGNFDIYEKSLRELEGIVKKKENQLPRLTEWLIKTTEESATRWDGAFDLEKTFNSLRYETDHPEMIPEEGSFVLDETFSAYTSVIARELTPAQKTRVSEVLFEDIREAWFTDTPRIVDQRLSRIVSNWERQRLAVYGFSMLQSVDPADLATRRIIMNFITSVAGDQELNLIYYQFENFENEADQPEAENGARAETPAKTKPEMLNDLLRNFEMRFQYIYSRNFVPES